MIHIGPACLVACMAFAQAGTLLAQGPTLFEQTPAPDGLLLSAASQDFPDDPGSTIFAADDFTVPAGPGWNVLSLHSFFTTGNGSGLAADVRWIVWDDGGPDGVPGAEVFSFVGGTYDVGGGDAHLDLVGKGQTLALPPGRYWFTSQIIGGIGTFGQEFHLGSLDGQGSANFHWNNPGGGFGFPVDGWFDAHATLDPDTDQPLSDVQSLAFRIGGSVIPEPQTLACLLLAIATVRRKRT